MISSITTLYVTFNGRLLIQTPKVQGGWGEGGEQDWGGHVKEGHEITISLYYYFD